MDRNSNLYKTITGFAENPDLYGFMQWLPANSLLLLKQTVSDMDGHEGSIWIIDNKNEQLVTCYNTEELARHVCQPLSSGLVSKAYNEERPIHHKGIHRYRDGSGMVDDKLEQKTQHQISVPFYVAGKLCGALSVVQLSSDFHSEPREDVPWGFSDASIPLLAATATVIAENIEADRITQQPEEED